MKTMHGDGLVYAGDKGPVSLYEMYLSNVIVMFASVNNADPDLKILVHRSDDVNFSIETPGRAVMALHSSYLDPDDLNSVQVSEHVTSQSIQEWVYPRLPWLLASLYVTDFTDMHTSAHDEVLVLIVNDDGVIS